ncbi:tRNA pseudouridine(55) synthase TruB [Niveibacterium sp. 24ML]|uniref:tRNA pseudouridine(55) synthase TruB n=1 Tax=Niveibacterium sp. 24ML TaxID=2985512 RepID=UPI00226E727A|nr:tRNA pseudouridine(55) synthase TruB [Niveibacterium sp. 24ML]MCX9156953.1 tRNA pseudouridine(55) synthase TruB [Niveibacterium sp. 24ML]
MKPARAPRLCIDGVVMLDKPVGMSSNAALQTVRRLYNAAKGGHTGTLDPLASGLLPLCLGEATKFSQMLLDADKSYRARVRLGVRTSTGDAEGEVIATAPVDARNEDVAEAVAGFLGEIEQVPPMYSALKRDGKALYEYARAGVTVERDARRVTIHAIKAGALDGQDFDLDVSCSKGTYIRTLAEDIGSRLGCGAHIVALRRTRIGPFEIGDAVSLEQLESSDAVRGASLRAADLLASHLPAVPLAPDAAGSFLHGQSVAVPLPPGAVECRVFADGRFLGLGRVSPDGRLAPRRLIASHAGA